MAELKRRSQEKAAEETTTEANGWSVMQKAIAGATGGVGLLAAIGAILKLVSYAVAWQ